MTCYYCDQIVASGATYTPAEAVHDLASGAPRCARHWRYVCGQCHQPAHYMASAWCSFEKQCYCAHCALGRREVASPFWAWQYYYEYQSPWSRQWQPALDRLEFSGKPLPLAAVAPQPWQERYPEARGQWRSPKTFTDADVRANWNTNAERWDARYDADGDRNRRYQSDEPMLALLGGVQGLRVLDVGSGNGYLCRKLARAGALMTGVELADEFVRIAREAEREEPLHITYLAASITAPGLLPEAAFDKAVSNYVLMDVPDHVGALRAVHRALRPGGSFVVVISHPCFACGPMGWVKDAIDSPRHEDRSAFRVDNYFHRGPYLSVWADFDPVLSFHRPLRDYWQAFAETGFTVDGFEEPSITDRGRRELPVAQVQQALRVPYSCIFRLRKGAA